MRILIAMSYDKNAEDYGKLTSDINKKYAQKWGYHFTEEKDISYLLTNTFTHITWNKIRLLQILLHEYAKDFDYIFYIDADAVFFNHDIPLESIIQKYPDYNIVLCDDRPMGGRLVNTGTILIKNTDWSRKFFNYWWNYGSKSKWKNIPTHEQDFLNDLLLKHDRSGMNVTNNIKVVDTTEFNSLAPLENNPDDIFILHYMASRKEDRIKLFRYLQNYFK